MKTTTKVPHKKHILIAPPNFKLIAVDIEGTAPYVQHKFSEKARKMIHDKHEEGSTAIGKRDRQPRKFQEEYEAAMYRGAKGEHGIPAINFRAGLVSACKTLGFPMTRAKLAFFIVADCYDEETGSPLVKITKGLPQYFETHVKLETGTVSLCVRPMWQPGWRATVKIRFDADMFSVSDALNLLARVGVQVGVGEGRADSPKSCGQGWGSFSVCANNKGNGKTHATKAK